MAEAKVLRLLRYDAARWWWFQTLRNQGRIEEARRLERESIRSNVRFIRENIKRRAITYRLDIIQFPDRPPSRPFDLQRMNGQSYTASCSNTGVGLFAAWVYCYAYRIGHKMTAKRYDTV